MLVSSYKTYPWLTLNGSHYAVYSLCSIMTINDYYIDINVDSCHFARFVECMVPPPQPDSQDVSVRVDGTCWPRKFVV